MKEHRSPKRSVLVALAVTSLAGCGARAVERPQLVAQAAAPPACEVSPREPGDGAGRSRAISLKGATTSQLRRAFARAQSFERAGRFADALEILQAIDERRPTAAVGFHIAMCHDELGRLGAAQAAYKLAIERAQGANEPTIESEARMRLADLELRMPRVFLVLRGSDQGVVVKVDGEQVATSRATRMDTGPHMVVATRDGREVAAAAFSVQQGETRVVSLPIGKPREKSEAPRWPLTRDGFQARR